jgi:hypothetical protein
MELRAEALVNSSYELHRQNKLTILFDFMTFPNLQQNILGRIDHLLSFHYILSILCYTDDIETTAFRTFSVVASVVAAAGTCLPGSFLAMADSTVFIIPAIRR